MKMTHSKRGEFGSDQIDKQLHSTTILTFWHTLHKAIQPQFNRVLCGILSTLKNEIESIKLPDISFIISVDLLASSKTEPAKP